MEHSVRFAVIRPRGCVHGGCKIASDLLTFSSVQSESNTEPVVLVLLLVVVAVAVVVFVVVFSRCSI